jgi:hypothetical protein
MREITNPIGGTAFEGYYQLTTGMLRDHLGASGLTIQQIVPPCRVGQAYSRFVPPEVKAFDAMLPNLFSAIHRGFSMDEKARA